MLCCDISHFDSWTHGHGLRFLLPWRGNADICITFQEFAVVSLPGCGAIAISILFVRKLPAETQTAVWPVGNVWTITEECYSLVGDSGVPRGGLGCSNPPPKFWRPSKIVPNSTRLWKLLKIAEFRTPTHQDVRKKGSKILKLPRFATDLH